MAKAESTGTDGSDVSLIASFGPPPELTSRTAYSNPVLPITNHMFAVAPSVPSCVLPAHG